MPLPEHRASSTLAELFGFLPQRIGFRLFEPFVFEQFGGETQVINISRIKSGDFVHIARNSFEQIDDAAVIGQPVLVRVELAPMFGVSDKTIKTFCPPTSLSSQA